MRLNPVTSLMVGTLALPFYSLADDVEHIVVTANGFEQSLKESLATVTVIDRETIEQSAAVDVPQLLTRVAGVQISRNGGLGQNSSLYIRGGNAGHTLIMIDGVRVGSATLGLKSISNLSLQQIDRIEVIKGPRAAWFGSDAVSGVIQIFTRHSDTTSVTAEYGADDYSKIVLASGIKTDDYYVDLTIGQEKTDGFNVNLLGDPDDDGYKNKTVTLTAGLTNLDIGDVTFVSSFNDGYYDYDSSFGADTADFRNYHAQVALNSEYASVKHKVSFGISSDQERYHGNDSSPSTYETDKQQFDYSALYTVNEYLQLSGGLSWYEEDIGDSSGEFVSFTKYKRDNTAVFVGSYFAMNGWSVNASVRNDDQNQFGDKTTYHATIGRDVLDNGRIRISQGSGFKAPTFNDLYSPFGGNLDLSPETSTQREFAFDYYWDNAELTFSFFENNINNLIVWTPDDDSGFVWSPKNISEAEIKGTEVDVSFQLFGADQQVVVSFLDTKDLFTGGDLPKRAEKSLVYNLTKSWQDVTTTLQFEYRGDSESGVPDVRLSSYQLWNLNIEYQVMKSLKANLKVNNLFDKDYQTSFGFETAGRQAYLGLTWTL